VLLAFSHDAGGRITRWADDRGRWRRYDYDATGRCVRAESAGGHLDRELSYLDNSTEVTNSLGHVTRYELDDRLRVVAESDPLGNTTRYELDEWGRLLARTDGLGRVTRYEVPDTETPGGATVLAWPEDDDRTYDTELRLVSVTDEQGLVCRYTYDPAGNLISETDGDGSTTLYGYDAAGQLVLRSNDAGETAVFTYDGAGRLTLARNADAEVAFDYDALGRVVAESINGRTIRYEYDRAGRRTTRRTPSGAMSRFTYDAAGRPAALHTAGRTVRFAYDPGGRESVRRLHGVVDTPVEPRAAGDPALREGGRWRHRHDAFGRRIAEQRLDGAGRIVEQTQFTWEGTNLAEEVRVGAGQPTVAVVWEWLPGTDRPVTRTRRVLGHDAVEFHAVPAGMP